MTPARFAGRRDASAKRATSLPSHSVAGDSRGESPEQEARAVVREITVEHLAARLAAGREPVALLDVRQPEENATAALPGGVLIPLDELPARAREIDVPAGAQLVVYCHHGVRSRSAAAFLERLGFDNVASLAGGIDAWSLRIDPKVPRY
jgi:adenylyltransferase/sulfurtransferase